MRAIRGLTVAVTRLALLPLRLAAALLGVTFRSGLRVGALPAKVTYRASRRVGWVGTTCFGLGLAAGVLLTPVTGSQLRARLRRLAAGTDAAVGDLAPRVVFELAHAPRTWHLPQPQVTVVDGRVTLVGEAPHETAREELVRTAAAVPGVGGVDDQLTVRGD